MIFIKVTGQITKKPMWINASHIIEIMSADAQNGSKILVDIVGGSQTMYVTEMPEEILNKIMDGLWLSGGAKECSST